MASAARLSPAHAPPAPLAGEGDAVECARCLYDSTIPGISLDADGVCSYCELHDRMEQQYPTGARGKAVLEAMAAEMKAAGRGKRYDCIVGVSGGCDSSYLVWLMTELGLRPLAVHFDNTWNSPAATNNVYNVLDALGVDLETLVVNNEEYDDLYRAFMLAGVADIEAPTDIGFMATLYRAAERHGISHIVEGHSFRTEGIMPLGWLYMDGRYIQSVHRQFGTRELATYPNMLMGDFLRWSVVRSFKRLRPLYHLDYDKPAVQRFLTREFGWQWYGGHHLENRFTAFYHSYFLPQRWGIDSRRLELSAFSRTGVMARADAAALLETPRVCDPQLLALVKKRLGFDDDAFDAVMALPKRSYRDYPTYKRRFELMKPIWWGLYKADRVPKSFYVKFAGGRV
jgi:N-acetyl sugar amidotransferase